MDRRTRRKKKVGKAEKQSEGAGGRLAEGERELRQEEKQEDKQKLLQARA
jgi:hypothetical protein